MAAILSVTYTPNYTGCHRICFKTTQASYCCYQDDSPSEIGVEKITVIDLTLYAECLVDVPFQIGCNDTNLIGYVQPCCTDATSLDNRVSFATTYETTSCTTYNVECTESGIGEVTINNSGYGWPVGVTPTITISDSSGIGSGFVGTVVMDCVPGENFCSIGSIVTDDPGVDYHFLNTLSVDISPLPSCESNNLIIDGNFVNGFLDWNVGPFVDSWLLTPSMVPYYNIPVYSSTGGTLEQVILTPGRTYLIDFEKVIVQARSGTVRFIVTAGLFSITGTASNQYMIALNSGDPDYDGPLSITLTCFGSSVFSIYADSSTTDVLNKASLTAVSVIELCEVIDPDLEVTLLDDCGTFTVPDCYGNDNPTTYKLWGGAAGISNINVCSGGVGPVGPKYNVTPNPVGVSCCDCIRHFVNVNTNPISVYYTDCNQNIQTYVIDNTRVAEICAVPDSIFPVNPDDNIHISDITQGSSCNV